MSIFFWRREKATWRDFWGLEERYGLNVLDDEMIKMDIPENHRKEIIKTVEWMMITKTTDILHEIKELSNSGVLNL